MRRDSKDNPRAKKAIARQKYAERQIDKYVKWSMEVRGYVKFKDILNQQKKYGIVCHSESKF